MKTFLATHTKDVKQLKKIPGEDGIHDNYEWTVVGKDTIVDATLQITDKLYKIAKENYEIVVGHKKCCNFDTILTYTIRNLNSAKTFNGYSYRVKAYSDNRGYAKTCKFRKEVIEVDIVVTAIGSNKFKVESVESNRVDLYSNEVREDKVFTNGYVTTLKHLEDFGFAVIGGFNSFKLNEEFKSALMSRLEGHLAPIRVG